MEPSKGAQRRTQARNCTEPKIYANPLKPKQVQDFFAALGEGASLSATDRASQLLVLGRDWLRQATEHSFWDFGGSGFM